MSQSTGCFVEEVVQDFSDCHHGQTSFAFKDFQVSMGESKCATGCSSNGDSSCAIACWDTSATDGYGNCPSKKEKDIKERKRCYANMLSPNCSCICPTEEDPQASCMGHGYGSGGIASTEERPNPYENCEPCGYGLTRIEYPIDEVVKPCCSGGSIVFDFFCNVELKEITLLNIDRAWPTPSPIKLYDCDNKKIGCVEVKNTGQNGLQKIDINTCNVQRMCVPLDGPGVICSLKYCVLRQCTTETFTWRFAGDMCDLLTREEGPSVLTMIDGLRLMHSRGFIKHVMVSLGKSGISGETKIQLKRHRRWPALSGHCCPLYKCEQFSFDCTAIDLFASCHSKPVIKADCGKPAGFLACDIPNGRVDPGDALSVDLVEIANCATCPVAQLADLTVQVVVCFPCNGSYQVRPPENTCCQWQAPESCSNPCCPTVSSREKTLIITEDEGGFHYDPPSVAVFFNAKPDYASFTYTSESPFLVVNPENGTIDSHSDGNISVCPDQTFITLKARNDEGCGCEAQVDISVCIVPCIAPSEIVGNKSMVFQTSGNTVTGVQIYTNSGGTLLTSVDDYFQPPAPLSYYSPVLTFDGNSIIATTLTGTGNIVVITASNGEGCDTTITVLVDINNQS